MKTFRVRILSPQRTEADLEAISAVVPLEDGLYGFLAGHEPCLAKTVSGTVRIRTAEGEREWLLQEGFLSMEPGQLKLFTNGIDKKGNTVF